MSLTPRIDAIEGNIESGTYTPTYTAVTNTSTPTHGKTFFTRIGNIVTVSGRCFFNQPATSLVEFRISLPIPTVISDTSDLAGTGSPVAASGYLSGSIWGDASNHEALVRLIPGDSLSSSFQYTFTYEIL